MNRQPNSATQPATFGPADLAKLRDRDLLLLMDLALCQLEDEVFEDESAAEFWTEFVSLLEAEGDRRRQEIRDLEKLYFSR